MILYMPVQRAGNGWRAIGGDYKDGLIREYTTDDNFLDGRVEDSKLMWVSRQL